MKSLSISNYGAGNDLARSRRRRMLGIPITNVGFGSSSSGVDLSGLGEQYFEKMKDANGKEYIMTSYPIATLEGLTMFADPGNLDLPSIYDGIPLGDGLQWLDGKIVATGGGGGGTMDHNDLLNRNAADQHSIAAISGLQAALNGKSPIHSHPYLSIADAQSNYWNKSNDGEFLKYRDTGNQANWIGNKIEYLYGNDKGGYPSFYGVSLTITQASTLQIHSAYNDSQMAMRTHNHETNRWNNWAIMYNSNNANHSNVDWTAKNIRGMQIAVAETNNCLASMHGGEGNTASYSSWSNYKWYDTNWQVGVRRGGSVDYHSFSISKNDDPYITINDTSMFFRNRMGLGCFPDNNTTLAIGDSDTGFTWEADGIIQFRADGAQRGGFNTTHMWTSPNIHLIVGSGGEGELRTRHVSGKHWQNDADDALYLNWRNQREVVFGGDIQLKYGKGIIDSTYGRTMLFTGWTEELQDFTEIRSTGSNVNVQGLAIGANGRIRFSGGAIATSGCDFNGAFNTDGHIYINRRWDSGNTNVGYDEWCLTREIRLFGYRDIATGIGAKIVLGNVNKYGTGALSQCGRIALCVGGLNGTTDDPTDEIIVADVDFVKLNRNTHVRGNILADGGITMLSDMRLKNRIDTVKSVLPSISDIDVFRYTLKADATKRAYIGVSAQQIQGIWSEFVHGVETLSLDYAQMAAYVAIKGLQETKLWMDSKDKKIAELEKRIVELENVA